MNTFVCSWRIHPDQATRDACMTLFGGMGPEDDARDLGSVELLGRWAVVGEARGHAVVRARTAAEVQAFLTSWVTMADITVTPVLTDDEQRAMLLGETPSWSSDASYDVGADPGAGESLYFIRYQFRPECRDQGFATFAAMTEEADKKDAGPCTALGRWHVPSEGRGFAVAAAASVGDIYRWAYNWNALCDCFVEAVTQDSVTRSILRSQPGFAEKHAALLETLPPPPGPCHVSVKLNFKDASSKKQFLDLLDGPEGLSVTRDYEGCEEVHVRASTDDPLEVMIQSTWTSRAAHDTYMEFRKSTGLFATVVDLLSKPFEMAHLSTVM